MNKELLDLVNENYQDFLSLGSALRGGEEKVEGVKVGVLSFQRDVKAIRDKVEARRQEVEELLNEKRRLRTNADVGKDLLDYADRVEELEHRLMIEDKSLQEDAPDESDTESDLYSGESEDSDDDELADGTPAISLKRMERHAQKFVYLTSIAARVGEKHPFLLAQQPRVAKIKSTVLLDLKSALEQATAAGSKQGKRDARTMAVLRLYELMGEDVSAVAALKNLKL